MQGAHHAETHCKMCKSNIATCIHVQAVERPSYDFTSVLQLEADMQHLLGRILNKDEVSPKDKYIVALLAMIQREDCLDLFFQQTTRSPFLKNSQAVIWKALSIIHRLMHFDENLFLQILQHHMDSINFLRRLCDHETSVYAKAASILGQLLLLKADFHSIYVEFVGSMMSKTAVADLYGTHGKELIMRLLELQQLNIACITVVLSFMDMPVKSIQRLQPYLSFHGRRQRLLQDQVNTCLVWGVLNAIAETVNTYEICFQLLVHMRLQGDDTIGVYHMFGAQHLKLRHIYDQVHSIPFLASKVYTLDLSTNIPPISSDNAPPSLPLRVRPSVDLHTDLVSADDSPVFPRKQQASDKTKDSVIGHQSSSDSHTDLVVWQSSQQKNAFMGRSESEMAKLQNQNKYCIGHGRLPEDRPAGEDNGTLLTEISTLLDQNKCLQQQLKELEDQREQQVLGFTQHINSLEIQLVETEQVSEMHRTTVQSLEGITADLNQALKREKMTSSDLRVKYEACMKEVECLKQEITAYSARACESNERCSSMEEQLLTALSSTKEVQSEMFSLRQDRDKAVTQVHLLEEQLKSFEKERILLFERVAQLKKDVLLEEERCCSLERILEDTEGRLEGSSSKVLAAVSSEVGAFNKLKIMQNERKQMEKELILCKAEIDQALSILQNSEEDFDSSQSELNDSFTALSSDIKSAEPGGKCFNQTNVELFNAEASSCATTQDDDVAQNSSKIHSPKTDTSPEVEAQALNQAAIKLRQTAIYFRSLYQSSKLKERILQENIDQSNDVIAELQGKIAESNTKVKQYEQRFTEHKLNCEVEATSTCKTLMVKLTDQLSQTLREGISKAREVNLEQLLTLLPSAVAQLKSHCGCLVNTRTSSDSTSKKLDFKDPADRQQLIGSVKYILQISNLLNIAIADSYDLAKEQAEQSLLERLASLCEAATEQLCYILTEIPRDKDTTSNTEHLQEAIAGVCDVAQNLLKLDEAAKNSLAYQMSESASAVETASARIASLLQEAKSSMYQDTLKVNGEILDQSLQLIGYVKGLIARSSDLQQEIVSDSIVQGTSISFSQFYKRNSRWVDGLVSAAKAVGAAATVLVDTADRTVSGSGKLEEIMVCGQEINASTAQLVSASRVKAKPNSSKQAELEQQSRNVHTATLALIEAVRTAGRKSRESHSAQDYLKLTVTQARRLQMDSMVRIKELEFELLQEQERLRQLRKAHYHLSESESTTASHSASKRASVSEL